MKYITIKHLLLKKIHVVKRLYIVAHYKKITMLSFLPNLDIAHNNLTKCISKINKCIIITHIQNMEFVVNSSVTKMYKFILILGYNPLSCFNKKS